MAGFSVRIRFRFVCIVFTVFMALVATLCNPVSVIQVVIPSSAILVPLVGR